MDGALSPEQLRLQARARAAEIDKTRDGGAGMTETAGKATLRRSREAAALRQNLKRRKAQSRARGGAETAGDGEPVAPGTR